MDIYGIVLTKQHLKTMQTLKNKFYKISAGLLIAVMVISVAAIITPQNAFADTLDEDAKSACKVYGDTGARKDANHFSTCVKGYKDRIAGKTKKQACEAGFSSGPSASKSACELGFDAAENRDCDQKNPTSAELDQCLRSNPLVKDIKQVVNFLSAGAGIIITGSIIWAGIKYIMAGNNANEISAAKQRILNSLIALLVFILIYAFLQWLLPGGVLFL